MKSFSISLLLIFFSISQLFAQKDTEHWFAPYFDSSKIPTISGYYHLLTFSTDSITPFEVKIYNNNIEIGSVTISKGNPQRFVLNEQYIRPNIVNQATAAAPTTLGVYTKGEKPYYVSMKMTDSLNGEIVTSKGRYGTGTKFYAVSAPITYSSSFFNFTTGILATEDNTTVTVSGYNSNIQFINLPNPPASITFTLNKGQSYILAGTGNIQANQTGFIGAKIESSKPVSVMNGNSNGTHATNITSLSATEDITMDQSVPVEHLGNEFALVRGLTASRLNNMEGGIIVATENNTDIYLNGSPTPVTTINEGEFYRIMDNSFVNPNNTTHYNMYIRTSKNAYLYQLSGSQRTGNEGTGSFSYIPPLNCYLPKKIDEIGEINYMPTIFLPNQYKLIIVTEAGATVTANGITPQGPYPLAGNSQWETYEYSYSQGVTGNTTITSTKALSFGITGGFGQLARAGYSGYYFDAPFTPVIEKKTGDCLPGIELEVNDDFDTYQWYLNGNLISGATTSTYIPTQIGNYTVKVSSGTCSPLTSPVYKVFSCPLETTSTLTVCDNIQTITPTFTSSSQTPLPSTVTILTQPTNGTATINPNTGVITYVPNPGFLGSDTIVYQFCGNATEFIDCEKVTLNLTVVPFTISDTVMEACQFEDQAYFDLTTADIVNNPLAIKKFYPTLADLNAGTNEITNPTNYGSTGGFVYVKVTTNEGCTADAKIELIAKPIKKSPLLVDQYICIDDRTTLDAGPDYDSYQWNTGATTSSISGVGVGEYTVILEKDGCFLTQVVKVMKPADPVISEIQISNNTATVIVNGGTPQYQYAVDGITNWQDSNVFTDLSRGQHTFYVKDEYNCTPVSVEVTVPNLLNAITPNGDNINDYIDYSALSYKGNLSFVVYDRYGNKVFTGNKFNNYTWDGKHQGKKLPTGTYWFHINWNEPNQDKTPIKYTGWILVKNRE
ncbi:T9SS type B sorting domain-containing protein [Chryseobacterium sp. CT-SW4]|uniref:T9SS type B sorting domain-containing protein n=1 Tax=Chryseobacterium sp. SW-1 TaxID=3157343 RepID=UPI003B02711B